MADCSPPPGIQSFFIEQPDFPVKELDRRGIPKNRQDFPAGEIVRAIDQQSPAQTGKVFAAMPGVDP